MSTPILRKKSGYDPIARAKSTSARNCRICHTHRHLRGMSTPDSCHLPNEDTKYLLWAAKQRNTPRGQNLGCTVNESASERQRPPSQLRTLNQVPLEVQQAMSSYPIGNTRMQPIEEGHARVLVVLFSKREEHSRPPDQTVAAALTLYFTQITSHTAAFCHVKAIACTPTPCHPCANALPGH